MPRLSRPDGKHRLSESAQAERHLLAQQLLARDERGRRSCIPVFGTGLNIQAATLAGYPQRDDWRLLLAKIGKVVLPRGHSIETLPHEPLSLWEHLVCLWARARHCYPFEAENKLQQFICEDLRQQEEECKSFQLYRDVALAGFDDIISLNFDRRIALSCKRQTLVAGQVTSALGSHGESLFRHSVVSHDDGSSTRIWYPHGDVKKAATIKFGVRKYGFYVGVMKEYMHGTSGAWRYRFSATERMPDSKEKLSTLENIPSWLPKAFLRPLVFIGCGLSHQEWPLWWMLRRRWEAGAPPALILVISNKGGLGYLAGLPQILPVVFPSPDALWSALLSWLSPAVEREGHA